MNREMDKVIGATLLVAGAVLVWAAIHMWHIKKEENDPHAGWRAGVVMLLVLAGLGLGGGASLLEGLSFLFVKVGAVPAWAMLAFFTGIWFLFDLIARHAWTRTPLLGFVTAMMIAVPVTPPALGAAMHQHQVPQVVSVTRHHNGG